MSHPLESSASLPAWALGPIAKRIDSHVLRLVNEGFDSWAVYNPAVAISRGRLHMFYRGEWRAEKDPPYFGTSRMGAAVSDDGVRFRRWLNLPGLDATLDWEIPGGLRGPPDRTPRRVAAHVLDGLRGLGSSLRRRI